MKNFLKHLFPNCHNIQIEKIIGGRNNRAYKILIDQNPFFLKHYNSINGQARLNAEYLFSKYAYEQRCNFVCQPIVSDASRFMTVFEFIQGETFKQQRIGQFEMSQALQFVNIINKTRKKSAIKLPNATEACFSIAEHLSHVEKRLHLLHSIPCTDDIDQKVRHFINFTLFPTWHDLKNNIIQKIKKNNLDMLLCLTRENRIVSPSDFGFHNALKLTDGQIKFVDFEYAGWDDPAKLIADFFNQIQIPVSLNYFNLFCEHLVQLIEDKEEMCLRAQLLLPLYRIKWICIVLNYFLPEKNCNKKFVSPITEQVRIEQLKKAKNLLNSLNDFVRIGK